jgi:hypothetical protein
MVEEPKVEPELTEEELAEKERQRKEKSLVLVGFGKHDLSEVLSWRGTPREEDAILAATKWPPRYRREAICEEEDVKNYMVYVDWLQGFNYKDYIAF